MAQQRRLMGACFVSLPVLLHCGCLVFVECSADHYLVAATLLDSSDSAPAEGVSVDVRLFDSEGAAILPEHHFAEPFFQDAGLFTHVTGGGISSCPGPFVHVSPPAVVAQIQIMVTRDSCVQTVTLQAGTDFRTVEPTPRGRELIVLEPIYVLPCEETSESLE